MRKKKLSWILFFSFSGMTLLSLSIAGGYSFIASKEFIYANTASDLEARCNILKKQIWEALATGKFKEIDEICKAAGNASSSRITVILPGGTVVGDTFVNPDKMENHANRPEIREAFSVKTGSSIRYSTTMQNNIMYVAVPLMVDNRAAAVIRTSLAVAAIEDQLGFIRKRLFFAGFLIALTAAGLSFWISRRITNPIQDMKQGAARFAEGDLDYRLPVASTEEMVGLSDALNQMAIQLRRRVKDVMDQRNELESVLSAMKEGVIAVDDSERIIKMNRAAEQILGVSTPLSPNAGILELTRNRDLDRFFKEALQSTDSTECDISFFQKEERVINIRSSLLTGTDGDRIGALLVFNDVTLLRHLESLRRDFAASVSHEIKTPLTAIKGFVETLNSGSPDDSAETKRFLKIIEKHVVRLESIIDDLMKLSGIEQEEGEVLKDSQQYRLKEILEKAAEICLPKAQEKGIRIELTSDEKILVNVNSTLFEQAAVNLIDNAIKYSPVKSVVRIQTEKTESGIMIRFKDQGIGIEKKHLPRLFERFYRVDKARSRSLGGTGLGLAIVKHVVKAHGGQVFVESIPGKGSTFSIALPRKETTSA
ncbi:MAG: hypothetical protein A2V65_04895 [Deltaproteobacteria bacterium RBG_13_49_15]|nr:MAG: hypothetical protein A2V65_04895 [Deltaproteobacteria bacterium RBG_13_49_15]